LCEFVHLNSIRRCRSCVLIAMICNRFLSWVDVVHLITPDGSLGFPSAEPLPDKSMEKINRNWRFLFVKSKQFVSFSDLTVAWSTTTADRGPCCGIAEAYAQTN